MQLLWLQWEPVYQIYLHQKLLQYKKNMQTIHLAMSPEVIQLMYSLVWDCLGLLQLFIGLLKGEFCNFHTHINPKPNSDLNSDPNLDPNLGSNWDPNSNPISDPTFPNRLTNQIDLNYYLSGQFEVPPGSLAFSVTLFTVCAVALLALIYIRRCLSIFGKAELGGPRNLKIASFGFAVFLWFFYVLFSALQSYGIIPGF